MEEPVTRSETTLDLSVNYDFRVPYDRSAHALRSKGMDFSEVFVFNCLNLSLTSIISRNQVNCQNKIVRITSLITSLIRIMQIYLRNAEHGGQTELKFCTTPKPHAIYYD